MVRIEGAGASDKGIRARNEDAFRELPDAGFFVLADGMGGYEGGQVASLVTVETLADFYARNASDRDLTWPFAIDGELDLESNQAIVGAHLAHAAVAARRRGPLREMGSTVAAIAFHGSHAVVMHAGDSRVYRLRAGKLERLTRDHSFVEELAAQATMDPAQRAALELQYGHVITRAIGIGKKLEPTVSRVALLAGDVFLLTTDGVHGVLDDDELGDLLAQLSPREAAHHVVTRAIDVGSRDNATAIVIRVAE
jgi:serine/threonine protein phosphatase PrpC